MRKFISIILIIAALYVFWDQRNSAFDSPDLSAPNSEVLAGAIRDQKSGVQVTGQGVVTKILSDDVEGSRHQRFILSLASGQTLLVSHNIDLAPRVTSLKKGDAVFFNGVYEWNKKGGVIHWTHHDPDGQHTPGWLKHKGQTFQ